MRVCVWWVAYQPLPSAVTSSSSSHTWVFVLYGFSVCGDESRRFSETWWESPSGVKETLLEFLIRAESLIPGRQRREKKREKKKPLRSPHIVFWQQGKSARFSCEDLVMC